MAFTATVMERGGWRNQARRLALAPRAAAGDVALLDQTPPTLALLRPDNPQGEPQDHEQLQAKPQPIARQEPAPDVQADLADLRQQLAVKIVAAKMLNERIRKLAAEGVAKDKRIATLESEVLAAREDLVHGDNENRSLQASLDLTLKESARLSGRVWDSGVEAEALAAQLNTARAGLARAEAERDRLTALTDGLRASHRIECDSLNGRLEDTMARNASLEISLMEARRELAAHAEQNGAAAREAADATLRQLHDALQVRDKQIHALDESRAQLMVSAANLLEAFEARAAALAAAEDKAKSLELRAVDADAEAAFAQRRIEGLSAKIEDQQTALTEAAEAIQLLAGRAAAMEADAQAAARGTEDLKLLVQEERARRAIAEIALSKVETEACRLRCEVGRLVKREEEREAQREAVRQEISQETRQETHQETRQETRQEIRQEAHQETRRETPREIREESRLIVNLEETYEAVREDVVPPPTLRSAEALLAATIAF